MTVKSADGFEIDSVETFCLYCESSALADFCVSFCSESTNNVSDNSSQENKNNLTHPSADGEVLCDTPATETVANKYKVRYMIVILSIVSIHVSEVQYFLDIERC